ncbi:hypothetical protein JCM10213_001804 [Rhodosporidiobolus nylandii]
MAYKDVKPKLEEPEDVKPKLEDLDDEDVKPTAEEALQRLRANAPAPADDVKRAPLDAGLTSNTTPPVDGIEDLAWQELRSVAPALYVELAQRRDETFAACQNAARKGRQLTSELIGHIISYLYSDPSTLAAACLASRSLLTLAQPRLYSTAEVGLLIDAENDEFIMVRPCDCSFMEAVASNPRLAAAVRKLALDIDGFFDDADSDFVPSGWWPKYAGVEEEDEDEGVDWYDVFRRFLKQEEGRLVFSKLDMTIRSVLGCFPRLETLSIPFCHPLCQDQILPLVPHLPSLRDLTVRQPYIHDSQIPERVGSLVDLGLADLFPALKRLSIPLRKHDPAGQDLLEWCGVRGMELDLQLH